MCTETACMAHRQGKDNQQAGGSSNGNPDEWKQCCVESRLAVCHRHPDQYYCEKDLYLQIGTKFRLYNGCFYYQDIGSSEAKQILKPCPVGTFLVRDSADSKYLYTISVRTKRGPTSIRICYEHGRFSLDAEEKSKNKMPNFSSLLELIDFYIRKSSGKESEQCRFLDKTGRKDLPIVMSKPKLNNVPTLKHLARTVINRSLPAPSSADVASLVDQLPLPKPLRSIIKDYPFLY